jgi:hypothetical protein
MHYYKWFISKFANIMKPLAKFTEEKQAQWTPEVEAAFQTQRRAYVPLLFLPTSSQEKGLLTQTRVTSGLEYSFHK